MQTRPKLAHGIGYGAQLDSAYKCSNVSTSRIPTSSHFQTKAVTYAGESIEGGRCDSRVPIQHYVANELLLIGRDLPRDGILRKINLSYRR